MTQEDLYALLPFVLLALVFWFLVFRPNRKRQREAMQTQASIESGVRVMLSSGIFGDVVSVGDSSVELEVAPDTVITVHRQAVGKVISPDDPADSDESDRDSDDSADDTTDIDDEMADDTSGADEHDLPPTHQENK